MAGWSRAMGRPPIGDRAVSNAEKQRAYRERLEERQRERARQSMDVSTQLLNALAKIRQLEYLLSVKETEESDTEQLKVDSQVLKEENRRLKKENGELKKRLKEYGNVT
jgi:hypothetical protein